MAYNNNGGEDTGSWSDGYLSLSGNLTSDPKELNGGAVSMRIAFNSKNRGQKAAFFFNVIAFGAVAQGILNDPKMVKGQGIVVSGQLFAEEWEDRDGNSQSGLTIKANCIGPRTIHFENDDAPRGGARRGSRDEGNAPRRRRVVEADDAADAAPRRRRVVSEGDDD